MLFGQVPYWILGLLGLAIVWVNALVIAAAAIGEARRLLRARSALGEVRKGTVASGRGEDDTLAMHEVDQVGRAIDAPVPAMLWHDRGYASTIFGGTVKVGEETIEIAESKEGEVWPSRERQIERSKCPSDEELDAHYKSSRGAKGAPRKVLTPIRKGDTVWIAKEGKLVSAIDPALWYGARARASLLFALAELGVCGACTAVALVPPHFGIASTIGGALLLLFFVFVQPIGVSVEDANRSPSERFLRGEWHRSAPLSGAEKNKQGAKPKKAPAT
jgi:hypothetical protein